MESLRIGSRTAIGLFIGGMALAIGSLIVMGFWYSAMTKAVWAGGALMAIGVAVLTVARTTEFDPISRTIRIKRSWLIVFRWLRERAFSDFSGVAIARTGSSDPQFCVMLVADEPLLLPTQGRNRKATRKRARHIAELMSLSVEEKAREVSSVPMV